MLSLWFVNNYIRKCAQLCPRNVSLLFDDVSTRVKLQNAVSAIVNWRLNRLGTIHNQWHIIAKTERIILAAVSMHSLSVRSLHWWLIEMANSNTSFSLYFIAVAFLHIARKISRNDFIYKFMDVLSTINWTVY